MKTINDYAELVKEKHALNKTIAPVETDLTDASRGYHIGEQFIYDGELYKAKTEIAQHDALVLNTNYEPADDLATQIKNAGGGTGTDPRLDVFENNIAPVETDETDASKAYQVGEQLILNNILYDVIAAISEHDVITTTGSGANIEPADSMSSKVQTLAKELEDEAATRSAMGAKNLIPLDYIKTANTHGTWNDNVYTDNGVVFTYNPTDGTVVADGTSNGGTGTYSSFYYAVRSDSASRINMPANKYRLTGCPSGGSSSTYMLYLNTKYQSNNQNDGGMTDDGNGATATYANDMWGGVYVSIADGTTVNNLTFKPMLRLASDIDESYQPYAKTNKELTDDVSSLNTALTPLTATLAQGATSVTIQDARITTSSVVIPVSETFGLVPDSVTVTTGQVVMTYQAQAQAKNVGVLVF